MRKFDAHSNLFQFIPSGNVYASVVTGATAILVKASVNHSKTIEELSDALDAITEAVSIGDTESNLIKSQATQNAVAKLYIAIFLFFGDAANWYKSSAASKVVHSLHKNFSERFRKSIDTIKEQAANVRYIAQLGSQAEVRVVRLEVEELQDQLQDIRVGMSGRFRQLAEYLHAQHGENMKQHEKTQELLSDYKAQGMLPAPPVAERDYQTLIQSTERIALIEAAPVPSAPREERARDETPQSASRTRSKSPLLLWQQLDEFFDLKESELGGLKLRQPFLVDRNLFQAVRNWLTVSDAILYLEHLSTVSREDTVEELRAQLTKSLRTGGSSVVPRFPGIAGRIHSHFSSHQQQAIALMIYLAYEIYKLHSDNEDGSDDDWNKATSVEDLSFDKAISILSNALSHCTSSRLHIILPGHPFLSDLSPSDYKSLLRMFRSHMNKSNMVLKVMILTRAKISLLLPHLHSHEIVLLRQLAGKQKTAKMQLVIPSAAGG